MSVKLYTWIAKGRDVVTRRLSGQDPERGSALEYVLMAVLGVLIAALIYGAVTGKVQELIGQL